MSGKTVEWLAVLIFFIFFFAFTVLEAYWLNKRSAVPLGKTFAFSFATNIFTITVGYLLSFVVYAVLLALVFGGVYGNDWRIWSIATAGLAMPMIISLLSKRLGLRVFKLDIGFSPWVFSFVATIVFLLAVTLPPVLFVYFA